MKYFVSLIFAGFLALNSLDASTVSIDGSSTVFPISEAVAEEARQVEELSDVRVGVSMSGTGGGFKKFCKKELDITGASRPIKPTELEACAKAGVEFIELPVAYDGIAVVTNKANQCVDELTVAQLKNIWEPAAQGKITNWNQINPDCPDQDLSLYGPGHDSGTFDYFTKVIVGKSKSSRADYTASEDDNTLVQGIIGDKGALGYFGFAYYIENASRLKVLGVNSEGRSVEPKTSTISDGSYSPLSRPIFIYVSKEAAKRPEVAALTRFYVESAHTLAPAVGYVSLGSDKVSAKAIYNLVLERFEKRQTGSLFTSRQSEKVSLERRLKQAL